MPGRLLRTDRGYGPRWYPAHALSGVAQLAERRTVNPQVVGSSPTPGATNMQVRVGLSGPALCASRAAFQHLSNLSPLPAPEERSDLLAGLPGPSRIGVPVAGVPRSTEPGNGHQPCQNGLVEDHSGGSRIEPPGEINTNQTAIRFGGHSRTRMVCVVGASAACPCPYGAVIP